MDDWSFSRRVFARGALTVPAVGISLANQAGAAPTNNVEIVLAFCKAGQARDVEAQLAFIPEDGTYHNMPDPIIVGKPAIRALLTGYLTGSDATEIIVKNISEAKSGTVLTERLDRFRTKGKWIDCPVMGAAEIENGKIKHWRDYYDNLYLRAQMS